LGFNINFFGKTRGAAYVNNNGNLTFDSALATFTPFGLDNTQREIIAPFFADVDTRSPGSKLVTYGQDTVNGHKAFGANYINVGYFAVHADKLNSFQVVLIDRSDTGDGNFDIEFNYAHIFWETGDASGGVNGFGGVPAAVGWSNGTGEPGTSYQYPGSLISGAFLDGGPHALNRQIVNQAVNSSNPSAVPGRLVYHARDGIISPGLVITSGVLPDAVLGKSYSTTLTVTGAKPPYRWTLTPDVTAPPGLTLDQNGVISGLPSDTGTYSFTLSVTATTEDGQATVSTRGSVTIHPATIAIVSACPLDDGNVGRPYSVTLRATGGSSGYVWSVDDRYSLPPGVGLSSGGLLAGTPLVSGTYIFNLRARGTALNDGQPAQRLCHLTVNPAAVRLSSGCAFPNATVGVPYAELMSADGGVGPYRFQLLGQLPQGLALTADGLVAGTPVTPVSYSFQISVTDSRATQTSRDCSLTVNPPAFSVSSVCPLPAGVTGSAYSAKLPGAYVWSLDGTLPSGLALSPDGTVLGTPMNAGPSRFLLIATDSSGNQAGQVCSLAVTRGSLSVGGCPLPDASVGQPYNATVRGLGGSAPYFFSYSGALPAGITLTSDGLASGTATAAGSYPFNVTVREASGQTFAQACSLNVNPTVLHITTSCPLPQAQLGQNYSARIAAAGGTAPYQFGFFGFLPDGLTSASDGSLKGTPRTLGAQAFLVQVTDAMSASAQVVCAVNVALPDVPDIQISGLSATAPPASANTAVTVALSQPYTQPITGQVLLSVQPDTPNSDGEANQADPRLSFANGQTAVSFSIAAGSQQVSVPLISTGTVASRVTVSLSQLRAAGVVLPVNPTPQIFNITRAAPVVTSACYTKTSTGLSFQLNGYSTTRELARADVVIGTQNVSIDLTGIAANFFTAPESIRAGGTFALTAPYNVALGATVPTITMNLFNTVGGAGSRTLAVCQ
jgi:hypothetical protein